MQNGKFFRRKDKAEVRSNRTDADNYLLLCRLLFLTFSIDRGTIGCPLEVELFGSQLHGRGDLFQGGAARFGTVLHLGVSSLGHVCPCCNLGLG